MNAGALFVGLVAGFCGTCTVLYFVHRAQEIDAFNVLSASLEGMRRS